jgi:hypothetical protein
MIPHNSCTIYNFGNVPSTAQASDVVIAQPSTLFPQYGLTLNATLYDNGSGGLAMEAGVCNLYSAGTATLPNPFEVNFYGFR